MSSAATAPTSLDALSLGRVLGRGVSGRVLRAEHSARSTAYALKTIEKARITGQSQLAQLYREKELLSCLRHPGIVRFHTTFKDDACLYFLLDKLDGGELLWHMRRSPGGRLPEEAARRCLGALLLPLRYMQEQGVLYRDLKPTNILFSRAGRLTLVDFAHAKRLGPGGSDAAEWQRSAAPLRTRTRAPHARGCGRAPEPPDPARHPCPRSERSDSVCGTPHFHAPETVRGDGHGPPAQLWALGVLLYEVLEGRPPFWEPKPGAAAAADGAGAAADAPPPLREQILAASPPLEKLPPGPRAVAAALLQADPAARAACFPQGYASVMGLAWLASLPWEALESGECVPQLGFEAHAREWDDLDGTAGGAAEEPGVGVFAGF